MVGQSLQVKVLKISSPRYCGGKNQIRSFVLGPKIDIRQKEKYKKKSEKRLPNFLIFCIFSQNRISLILFAIIQPLSDIFKERIL